MLFVSAGAVEQCESDKEKINVICPSIWVHYVIGGKGYCNGQTVTAGQAFIVYKNDICQYYPDKDDPWAYIWMRFEGEDDEGILKRSSFPKESGVFSFDYKEKLLVLANAFFDKESSQITNKMYGEAIAKMVLSLHADGSAEESYAKDENWVIKAKAYISANYHRRLTVEQIALFLHIDRQYLRNLFVKYTGMSTKAYLDAYRMSRAAELLKMKGGSVIMVALSVGYSDSLAFSKAFKKHFGMSPSKYREEFASNPSCLSQ